MRNLFLISLLMVFSLYAGQHKYLAFSGGKFGKSSSQQSSSSAPVITSDLNQEFKNTLRAKDHCHSTSWLRGHIRTQHWNYWLFHKIQVTAKSTTTFGTRRKSCNLPLKVPYISAKASATAEEFRPHFGWITFNLGSKLRIKHNTSGITARFKDKQYGEKRHSAVDGFSEHVAKGGRIGKKVLRIRLQKPF